MCDDVGLNVLRCPPLLCVHVCVGACVCVCVCVSYLDSYGESDLGLRSGLGLLSCVCVNHSV